MSYIDIATWGWPQAVYLFLTATGFGYVVSKHGQPRNDHWSIWTTLFATTVVLSILYYGRFFG